MASTRPTPLATVDALSTVRPALLWPAIVARLRADTELATLLGTAAADDGRVTQARTRAERTFTGDARDIWGRVVIVPVTRLAPLTEDAPNAPRTVPFLVRVDANEPERDDYDPRLTLEAVHARVYRLLVGWATTVRGARVVRPIWRENAPQPEPLWDDDGGVLYSSAEYRMDAVPAPLT